MYERDKAPEDKGEGTLGTALFPSALPSSLHITSMLLTFLDPLSSQRLYHSALKGILGDALYPAVSTKNQCSMHKKFRFEAAEL